MNINIRNGNVIDELKKVPDESVDCVISSPPYYSLRDYSAVATYSASSVDEVMETANIDLQSHRDRVPDHQKDRYYLTDPLFDDKKKRWHVSLKYDVSEIWGGDPECKHGWGEVIPRQHEGGGNNGVPAEWQRPSRESHVGGNSGMFCNKCNAWKGQIGLEPTYELYTQHLMLVMKELKRILKRTGTLFWNMGYSYSGSGSDISSKSLMMIPERFAIAMIDAGWILRNTLCWLKRNAMPSSVKDRFSNKWEYVFFFTKSQRYYFDLDSIRKPLEESSMKRISQENIPNQFQEGKSVDFAETDPVNDIPNILNNMHKKYNRANTGANNKEPYKKNNPHLMRLNANKQFFNEKGQGGNVDYNGIDSENGNHYNENGANPGDVIYNSKYGESNKNTSQYSQRISEIEKARRQSYIDAEKLYPDDIQKQKEYIKNIHDHLGNPDGPNPGDVVTSGKKPYAIAERGKDYVEYRKLPPIKELSNFLNEYRTKLGYTIDQIEDKMNSQAPHHWFNAESYPSSDDWKNIKDILMLPDTYDKAMTEVFLKPSEKQNDPNGANPGDVNQDETLYDLFTDPNIQDAFIDYLESERPELLMPTILDIPTMSHSFAHFAVFPETLVNPLIKAGCSSEVCVKCGKPKERIVETNNPSKEFIDKSEEYYQSSGQSSKSLHRNKKDGMNGVYYTGKTIGWMPTCKCNAGFEPGTVLDPFAGSGTVGVVAKEQGKNAILIEVSPEYVEIIKNRLEIKGSGTDINAGFVDVASIEGMEEDE